GLGRRIGSENGQKPSGWPIKYPGHASLDHRYEAQASALSWLARRRGSFPDRSLRVWYRLLWAGDLSRGAQRASWLAHQRIVLGDNHVLRSRSPDTAPQCSPASAAEALSLRLIALLRSGVFISISVPFALGLTAQVGFLT